MQTFNRVDVKAGFRLIWVGIRADTQQGWGREAGLSVGVKQVAV